jgi:hypothetical protein
MGSQGDPLAYRQDGEDWFKLLFRWIDVVVRGARGNVEGDLTI